MTFGSIALATTLCSSRVSTWTGRRVGRQGTAFISFTLELISRCEKDFNQSHRPVSQPPAVTPSYICHVSGGGAFMTDLFSALTRRPDKHMLTDAD